LAIRDGQNRLEPCNTFWFCFRLCLTVVVYVRFHEVVQVEVRINTFVIIKILFLKVSI